MAIFDPTLVGNLQFWFEPAKGGMFQDTGTVTAAVADTDPIGHLPDFSGFVYDAIQATAGNRALLKTTAFNGLPCARFDGTNDSLSLGNPANLAGASRGSYTLTYCMQVTTLGSCNTILSRGVADVDVWNWIGTLGTSTGGVGYGVRAKSKPAYNAITTGVRYVITQRTTCTNVAQQNSPGYGSFLTEFFVNGQLIGAHLTPTSSIGTNWWLGARNDGNFFFNGDLAGLVFYNRSLTETERESVEGYFSGKYAVALSRLPAPADQTVNLAIDGNSIPAGGGGGSYQPYYSQIKSRLAFGHSAHLIAADGLATTTNTSNLGMLLVPVLDPSRLNVVVHHEITNELAAGTSAATCYANILAYANAVKALIPTPKLIVMTPIARNFAANQAAYEANRQTVMASMLANASPPWDYLLDVGNATTITVFGTAYNVAAVGAPGAYSNTTYFMADGVHLNPTGYGVIGPPLAAAINGLAAKWLKQPTDYAVLADSNQRVDVSKVSGTTQTARDIGANVLVSSGTGSGQILLAAGLVTVGTNNDKTGYALTLTPAVAGDPMTLTAAYDFARGTVAMAESYAGDGLPMTPAQCFHQIWSLLAERTITGATLTTKKLDGSLTAMTFTLDSSTLPTAQTRTG